MKTFRRLGSWLPLFLCALACIISLTCFRVIVTDGPSMEPTYTPGDMLLCFRSFREPQVGDVVLIQRDGSFLVKRVQFVAGQTPFLFTGGNELQTGSLEEWLEGPIPEGYIFVAGDNPAESLDSRYEEFGLVSVDEVWGTILMKVKDR